MKSGEKHSNHGNDAKEAVARMVKMIRNNMMKWSRLLSVPTVVFCLMRICYILRMNSGLNMLSSANSILQYIMQCSVEKFANVREWRQSGVMGVL